MTIHTNVLGEYSPKAQVVRVRIPAHKTLGGDGFVTVPASERWAWHCESDAEAPELPADATAELIASSLDASGWDCEIRTNGFGRPEIWATHRETERAMREAADADEERFAGAERGYVRYGELPEGGRSRNHRDGFLEAGVSCFPAEFAKDGSWRLATNAVTKVDALAYQADGARVYRLWGAEVGTGSDGEPLLRVERCEEI